MSQVGRGIQSEMEEVNHKLDLLLRLQQQQQQPQRNPSTFYSPSAASSPEKSPTLKERSDSFHQTASCSDSDPTLPIHPQLSSPIPFTASPYLRNRFFDEATNALVISNPILDSVTKLNSSSSQPNKCQRNKSRQNVMQTIESLTETNSEIDQDLVTKSADAEIDELDETHV